MDHDDAADRSPDSSPAPDSGPAPDLDPGPTPALEGLPLGQLMGLLYAATRAVTERLAAPDALRELAPLALAASPTASPGDSTGGSPSTSSSGFRDWGAMLPDPGTTASDPTLPAPVSPDAAVTPASPADGSLPPIPSAPPAASDGVTLPTLQQVLENIGRSVTAAQMSLAGHTVATFEDPSDRERLLGLPAGKTAFRDPADYLRLALRIDGAEARRRIRWVASLRPTHTLSGEVLPPRLPLLAEAVLGGSVDRTAVDVISEAMDKARQMARRVGADPHAVGPLLEDGEERLVSQALSVDPGTLRKVSNHWLTWFEATVDPDGAEPNDADLPQMQGMIRKGKRNGLHHWLLAVDDAQNEYLETISSAATNPRAQYRGSAEGREVGDSGDSGDSGDAAEWQLMAEALTDGGGEYTAVPALDPRSRNQQQLDGLIACIAGGLALIESDRLPSSGGQRPQVAVTIDFHTLLGDLEAAGSRSAEDLSQFESSAAFTGMIHPNIIRAMACDSDILPVVLGAQGEVLDVGRAQRLFPTRLRQAIAARDGGCTAPGCWIPAPWCEAHHVEHWEHGGPTSVENGVLLCAHHHHAVHSGAWDIDMRSGSPWFIPAPYLDPRRQPQRNLYWRQR